MSASTETEQWVDVIIPFLDWNDWVLDCLEGFTHSSYRTFRLWLLPNELPASLWKQRLDALNLPQDCHIIPTGPGTCPVKRNIGLRKTTAAIVAFIDSDAIPHYDWLRRGVSQLQGDIAMVAGPNLTPPTDPWQRQIAGYVMESPWGFGAAYIRHTPVSRRTVPEMPTCNLILKRQRGLYFEEHMRTADDLVYCHEIRRLGKQILYDPGVIVYHHRRKVFRPFMAQVFRYGLDRGTIIYRWRSWEHLWQLMPSLLTLYLAILPALLWQSQSQLHTILAATPAAAYLLIITTEGLRRGPDWLSRILTPLAFLAGHLSYGVGFLMGIFKGDTPKSKSSSSASN